MRKILADSLKNAKRKFSIFSHFGNIIYQYPTVEVKEAVLVSPPYGNQDYDIIGIGEQRFVHNGKTILYTSGLVDCIGISVWHPSCKIACLKHASKMELRPETQRTFKQYFIDSLIERIGQDNLSVTEVNLCSSYWSQDLEIVIELMKENDFNIQGITVPDMLVEYTEVGRDFYVNKEFITEAYSKGESAPQTTMVLNAANGHVGVKTCLR